MKQNLYQKQQKVTPHLFLLPNDTDVSSDDEDNNYIRIAEFHMTPRLSSLMISPHIQIQKLLYDQFLQVTFKNH